MRLGTRAVGTTPAVPPRLDWFSVFTNRVSDRNPVCRIRENKKPLRETQGPPAPVSLYEDGALLPDLLRPDNGGVSGESYCQPILVAFAFPTPRPIHRLRYHPISTVQGLSGVRFGDYSSGSQSLSINCRYYTIAWAACQKRICMNSHCFEFDKKGRSVYT